MSNEQLQPANDPYLTVKEVAYKVRIKPETLRAMVRKGLGPIHIRTGRKILFKASDVDNWLKGLEKALVG